MSLDRADEIIQLVEAALRKANFRNDYEALNAYESNLARISEARQLLSTFSGARVDGMLRHCDDLQRDWNKRYEAQPKATQSDAVALGGEWIQALQAEDEIDEMEELTAANAAKKKQKAKGKRQKGPSGVDLTDSRGTQRDTKNEKEGMPRGASLVYLMHPQSEMDLETIEVSTAKPSRHREGHLPPKHQLPSVESLEALTLETHALSLTSAIPVEVVASASSCRVVPMEGTAFAELMFDTPLTLPAYDHTVVYHVQMFRAVIAAVASSSSAERRSISPSKGAVSPASRAAPGPLVSPTAAVPVSPSAACPPDCGEADEDCVLLSSDSEGDTTEETRNQKVWKKMGSEEFEVLQDLSTALVAEYDVKADDDEAYYTSAKELPKTLAAPLDYLRAVSTSTWVILLCHGGYFAGAVYCNTKPILHKSFHRYVVRKKQGGKQSSHDKGGGSGGSAGGQIRRGQEVKWKLAVRDLLLAWRSEIDKAWIILFAAPGPDNRAMLTDFSLLPPSASGAREKSPIDMKDPRVRSVPMTSHRPTFNEVQRVYETVSKCTIRIKKTPVASSDE